MYHHNYVVDTLNVSMQVKREKVSDLQFFVVQNLILFKLRGGWAGTARGERLGRPAAQFIVYNCMCSFDEARGQSADCRVQWDITKLTVHNSYVLF